MTRWRTILASVCLAGCVVAAWLTPAGPRGGWQPPAGQWVAGFLADGRTLATVTGGGLGHTERGPLRLWDAATGESRGEVTLPEPFGRAMTIAGTDRVAIQAAGPGTWPTCVPVACTLVPVDARTGGRGPTFRASPDRGNAWWVFADAGRTLAVNTVEAGRPAVDVFDALTGERRCRISGGEEPLTLSPDGRRLACRHGKGIAVFDLPAGREVARFPPGTGTPQWGESWPRHFSPDGTLLLDGAGGVFDLATGRELYRAAGVFANNAFFTDDGATLVVAATTAGECYLEYRDARTGDLRPGTRRFLLAAQRADMSLRHQPGHDLFTASGQLDPRTPTWYDLWLAKLPGLAGRARPSYAHVTEVIRTATGDRVWRGPVAAWSVTPDGRGLLTLDREADQFAIWDAPPRRPWRWMAVAVVAWTVAVVMTASVVGWLLAWRRRRRS